MEEPEMRKSKWSKRQAIVATALALIAASASAGQITLYERPGFQGRSMTTGETLPNLEQSAFNDPRHRSLSALERGKPALKPIFAAGARNSFPAITAGSEPR
jgi:hypothetical protein